MPGLCTRFLEKYVTFCPPPLLDSHVKPVLLKIMSNLMPRLSVSWDPLEIEGGVGLEFVGVADSQGSCLPQYYCMYNPEFSVLSLCDAAHDVVCLLWLAVGRIYGVGRTQGRGDQSMGSCTDSAIRATNHLARRPTPALLASRAAIPSVPVLSVFSHLALNRLYRSLSPCVPMCICLLCALWQCPSTLDHTRLTPILLWK